jgi:redox-sensing transcriptional repressor
MPKRDPKTRDQVPRATVARLALYLRELQHLERLGETTVKSRWLGQKLGLTDAQVRRDLSIFGQFGQRGVGYSVRRLCGAIGDIMGTDRRWPVILIGMGNLGRALSGYRGFEKQGFDLVAIFDSAPELVGTPFHGRRVESLDRLEAVVRKHKVQLAILAVPGSSVQELVDRLEKAGVNGVLNFAPVRILTNSASMSVMDVDMALELQRLAFEVVNRSEND